MKTDEQLLTIHQVAKMFGVNVSTIYKLARQGTIPGKKIGKHWRFNLEALNAYLEKIEEK